MSVRTALCWKRGIHRSSLIMLILEFYNSESCSHVGRLHKMLCNILLFDYFILCF